MISLRRPRLLSSLSASLLACSMLVACGGPGAPAAPAPASANAPVNASSANANASATTATPPADTSPKPAAADALAVDRAKAEADAATLARDTRPTVKVIDTGAAPKRALRYRFKPGTTEYLEMDMGIAIAMSLNGTAGPRIELPNVRSTMRIDGKEVTPEGDLRCTFVTEKVDVVKGPKDNPKLREAIEKEIGGLVGMHGKARISPRGVTSETEFELPPGASAALQNQLETIRDAIRQMYVPLPEEEVGKGAKWDVTLRVPLGGAMMDSTMKYTLTKVDADSAQADVETSFSAPPNQPMKLATLPPGATAVLDSLAGHGAGKVAPSFVRLVGTGSNTLSMESSFHVTTATEKVDAKMQSDITVSSRPGKAPTPAAAKKK